MKVTYKRLLVVKDRLCQTLGRQRPSLKVLARHSEEFTYLQSISAGLKLNVAMESFAEQRFCACCSTNLSKSRVCPTCLETTAGKRMSSHLKGRSSCRTWKAKTRLELDDISVKKRSTNRERYGADHHMQSAEFFHNFSSCRHATKYVDLQGSTYPMQGYEPQVARSMLSKLKGSEFHATEETFTYRLDGKKRRYYPDFEIRCAEETYVVEVKSLWTLESRMERNLAKFRAAKAALSSKTFVLVVYVPKLRRAVGIKNPTMQSVQQVVAKLEAALAAL